MLNKKFASILILLASAIFTFAQEPSSQTATVQQSPEAQQEEKLKLERKAISLLEQVVTEAQALKLPENRIRVHITAADMLWGRNQARARGLLSDAGAVLGQMMLDGNRNDRGDAQTVSQLRQELVLTAARHDAELAYQLFRQTQPPPDSITTGNRRRGPDAQDNLEQSLLAVIASTDPKVAFQKATEMLDKGEYPNGLSGVLSQLQSKDPEAYKKLSDKTLSRLGSDNLVASREAATLALGLLMPGPRLAQDSRAAAPDASTLNSRVVSPQVLSESSYRDLLDNTVTASLSLTSLNVATSARPGGGGARGPFRTAQPNQQNPQTPPDDAQVRQNNARTLLFGLSGMLSQLDQYLPERAQAVRQKMSDLGMGNNSMLNFGSQMRTAMQQGTSESLATAASTAPPQMQPMLYRQAAQRAIEEGNTERALQIANDHLDESGRNSITQAVDFKQMVTTAAPEKLNEIKQKLAALPSDSDRVKYLIDLANASQKDNSKLALRFLEDARALVNKRATNFREFEDQLRVARAFAVLDPKRSFDVLEPGITQLNELLSAAQVLSGFEIQVFQDGELPIRGRSGLGNMVTRYGQELAILAKSDFERARMTADRFQLAEPRIFARLSIVQGALGFRPAGVDNRRRLQNFDFITR